MTELADTAAQTSAPAAPDAPAAPAAPTAQRLAMVPIDQIAESLHNPRKTFDAAALQELASSIAATGVHQPLLLRPLPGSRAADTFARRRAGAPLPTFELVCGARRLRACHIAGVAQVPSLIRELTDTQALEAQVIENLQREDVTPLEEAEGYQVLMSSGPLTADQVATKIGKSRSYVYSRIKVLDLCPQGREALRKGGIDFSRALLAARIPDEALQIKALAYMTRKDYGGDTPSYRECAAHVQSQYMLDLSKARFKITDAALLPDAGSCKDCPKRTGANPDLFTDVKGADVCTHPPCYHAKEQAHTDAQAAQAQAKGHTVITGKAAVELWSQGYPPKIIGYRRLDDVADSPTSAPLRKIIGAQMQAEGIKPVRIESSRDKGKLVDALPNDVALRLLKSVEGQAAAAPKAVAQEIKAFADDKKAKALAKAAEKYEQAWRNQLMASTWAAISKTERADLFTLDVFRYVVRAEVGSLSTEHAQHLSELLGLGKVGAASALHDFANTTPRPDLLLLICIAQRDASAQHYRHNRPKNEGLMLVAEVALQEALAHVIADAQAQAKAQFLPKQPKPAAPKPIAEPPCTEGPAAQAKSTRAKQSLKGAKTPPLRKPKLSAADATAQIAAALQAAETQAIHAPAAQGIAGPDAASRIDPTAPADHAVPKLKARAIKPSASDAAPTFKAGDLAIVKATCANGKWRGRRVTVTGVKANTVKVRQADTPPPTAERCEFFPEDLEPTQP